MYDPGEKWIVVRWWPIVWSKKNRGSLPSKKETQGGRARRKEKKKAGAYDRGEDQSGNHNKKKERLGLPRGKREKGPAISCVPECASSSGELPQAEKEKTIGETIQEKRGSRG